MAHRDDIAARALNALEPDEARHFDLAASDEDRAALADYHEALAELAAEAETPPPANLRATLLAQIATMPQEEPGAAPVSLDPARGRDVEASTHTVEADRTLEKPAGPKEQSARRRWTSRTTVWLVSAAAAAAVVIGGVTVANNMQEADLAAQIAQAADVQSLTVEVTGGGTAHVHWSESIGDSVIEFTGLPSLDEQVYEAWYIRGDQATPAGIFDADSGTTVHVLEGTMQPGDVIGITIEPAGGSESPTSDPIMVADTTA